MRLGAAGRDGDFDMEDAVARFHAAHEQRFTYRLDTGVQIVNFHLVATVSVPKPELAKKTVTGTRLEAAALP